MLDLACPSGKRRGAWHQDQSGGHRLHPSHVLVRGVSRTPHAADVGREAVMRVVHVKVEPYDVYIGRGPGSRWGNPYSHLASSAALFVAASRRDAIEKYEAYVRSQPELLAALHEIAGKTLGCWCAPLACHGEILIKLCREKGLI